MHREHPLRIVRYSIKNIWLLIFPILRSIFSQRSSPEAALRWIQGSWFDILILLVILGFGWLRWYCRTFSVQNGGIRLQEGILIRRIRYLPTSHLSALTLEYPLWLRPFGGMYVYADTASGLRHAHDLRLLIRRQDAEQFRRTLPVIRYSERAVLRTQVHPWRIFLFSVIFSSSLSGALYTAAFWFQGGRISRDLVEEFAIPQRLGEVSEEVARHLYGISPAAVTIGIAILSMWLLSLLNNLLRYWGFSMLTDCRRIFIRSGILTKRSFWLQRDKINYLDLRQNLLTKLCSVFSVAVNCPGYGSQRGTIPVCLPILKQQELSEILPVLSPGIALSKNQLKAPLSAWWGFVWAPVLGLAAVVPAAIILRHLFPRVENVIGFLQWMLLIPIGWKLLVQITALLTSGVSMNGSRICLRYCRGLVFHTILTDVDSTAKIQISRYPWQRWFGKCNVTFYFRSEGTRGVMLKNLDMDGAEEMVKRMGYVVR